MATRKRNRSAGNQVKRRESEFSPEQGCQERVQEKKGDAELEIVRRDLGLVVSLGSWGISNFEYAEN